MPNPQYVLLTGCAGFIGSRTTELLLDQGDHIVGIDNMNDYYDVRIKGNRLSKLITHKNFTFVNVDIENYDNKCHGDIEPARPDEEI